MLNLQTRLHCFTDQVQANISNFADGECSVEFLENTRGKDVLLCRVQAPVNDNLNGTSSND